ncbi:MAG: hypothetical protein KAI28_08715 [Sphingomonadales bacterium]|nr:hypothetical protein [Sphingomonadales bacterium]
MLKFGAVVGAGLMLSGCYVGGYGDDGSRWVAYVDDETQYITAVSDTGLLCKGMIDELHLDKWKPENKVDMKRLFLTCSTSSHKGEPGPITNVIIGGHENKTNIAEFSGQKEDGDLTTYYQVKWRIYDRLMNEDLFLREYTMNGKTQIGPVSRTGDFKEAASGSELEAELAKVFQGEIRNHANR